MRFFTPFFMILTFLALHSGESKLHSVIDTTQSHVTKKYSSNLKRQFHKFFETIAFMI